MKIQFKFDEKDYKEILVIFSKDNEEDADVDLKTDRDNFRGLVVNPVLMFSKEQNPENTYEVIEEGDSIIKILCPSGDGETFLNQLYRSFYCLIKYLEADILNEKYSEEERGEIAKKVSNEVNKLGLDEIKNSLILTIENDEQEQ